MMVSKAGGDWARMWTHMFGLHCAFSFAVLDYHRCAILNLTLCPEAQVVVVSECFNWLHLVWKLGYFVQFGPGELFMFVPLRLVHHNVFCGAHLEDESEASQMVYCAAAHFLRRVGFIEHSIPNAPVLVTAESISVQHTIWGVLWDQFQLWQPDDMNKVFEAVHPNRAGYWSADSHLISRSSKQGPSQGPCKKLCVVLWSTED